MTYTPAPNIETTLVGLHLSDLRYDKGRQDDIIRLHVYDSKHKYRTFELYHDQDCCESVRVIDIVGDIHNTCIGDLTEVKEQIIRYEGPNTPGWPKDVESPSDSGTLTIFTFKAPHGQVVVRWLGESNGYYSESVSFREVTRA